MSIEDSAVYSLGNNFRLKNVIAKVRHGEKVTAAYIGGSITAGMGADENNCYAKLSVYILAEKFGTGSNVECVNAGLSGTSSTLGIIRLEKDVLSKNPDIVFVEYAVNDSTEAPAQAAYESLVRTALNCGSNPAVVLIICLLESGYAAHEHMKKIGEHYKLPIISVYDAMSAEFSSGRLKWADYSDDSSHPSRWGHKLIAGFIGKLFDDTDKAVADDEYILPTECCIAAPYENLSVIMPSCPSKNVISVINRGSFAADGKGAYGFEESWHSEGENGSMKIQAHTRSAFIAYKRDKIDTMGAFDVIINGEKAAHIDTYQEASWGEPFAEQLADYDYPRDIVIEIVPSGDNGEKNIDIFAVACTDY